MGADVAGGYGAEPVTRPAGTNPGNLLILLLTDAAAVMGWQQALSESDILCGCGKKAATTIGIRLTSNVSK